MTGKRSIVWLLALMWITALAVPHIACADVADACDCCASENECACDEAPDEPTPPDSDCGACVSSPVAPPSGTVPTRSAASSSQTPVAVLQLDSVPEHPALTTSTAEDQTQASLDALPHSLSARAPPTL